MARAELAHASVRTDSINGLAQSIAKPAYRRLLTAEPALRRAVPALIIAFLVTICAGAFVQILDHRRQSVSDTLTQIEAGADVLAVRIERARAERTDLGVPAELDRLSPPWLRTNGRTLVLANADGVLVSGLRYLLLTTSEGTGVAAASLEAGIVGKRLL